MPRHFSMLRDFHLADWFTLANAFCGTGAVFASMRYLHEGQVRDLLAGMAFGARPELNRRDFALVFHAWPWGPGGAITLGNTILHTGDTLDSQCVAYEHRAGRCQHPPIKLGDHERAHVYQYMVLGPLFLPAYLLCGGVSVPQPVRARGRPLRHDRARLVAVARRRTVTVF